MVEMRDDILTSLLDSNGPIFMPNSRLLQQMLRFDFGSYQEEVADGKVSLDPTVLCVPRGMIKKQV
jgi:hypothetical protein